MTSAERRSAVAFRRRRGPVRQLRCRALAVAITLVPATAVACGSFTGIDGPRAQPYLQALRVAGTDTQVVWIEWQTPSDSSFTTEPRPVTANLVSLRLAGDDGVEAALEPDPTLPGRFLATLSAQSGARYTLDGTVDGHPVHGETRVPRPLLVAAPTDSLVVSRSGCVVTCGVPYQWHADGATGFLILQSDSVGLSPTPGNGQALAVFDTSGTLDLVPGSPGEDRLDILALDPAAASFLLASTPKSNLTGIFGVLGSASTSRRTIRWQ